MNLKDIFYKYRSSVEMDPDRITLELWY